MPLTKIVNLLERTEEIFNPTAGSASGSHAYVVTPWRSQITECGFAPQTTITSNTTLAVNISKYLSSTASVLTEIISSTLGTFNSVMLIPGQIASVAPPSPAYAEAGDIIRLTTSGGNAATIGATMYVNFRRA